MRRKVSITNKTDFDTRNLRSLILAVARRELKAKQYPAMVVTIGYPRRNYVTGKATINRPDGSTATFAVFIPKDCTDVVEVCARIKTCLDYVQGKHGGGIGTEFNDWWERKGKPEHFPFAKKYTLAKAMPRTASKLVGAAASMKKAEYAQEKVHYWERKIKYATTMLKKWQRQLRYHSTRGEKLQAEEATALESRGMTVEDFYKGRGEEGQ